MVIFILVVVVLVVVVGIFAVQCAIIVSAPTGAIPETGLVFPVLEGDNAGSIAADLREVGAIRSARFFRWYSKLKRYDSRYKVGAYFIPAGQSTRDIAKLLYSGKIILINIVVPEGRTLRQTAAIFDAQGICSAADFIAAASDPTLLREFNIRGETAEGFLFPNTYKVPPQFPAHRAVRMMISGFFSELKKIYPDYGDLSASELYARVNMAGLVEKEYRVDDEAPRIASVFYNRLDRNMRLESCATVIYVLTERLRRPHPNRIFFSDLEVESPFNTYRNLGLPPAPISSPGSVALSAAFRPEVSNYLFFVVADPVVGRHTFTSTLSDHSKAREIYLESFAPKG